MDVLWLQAITRFTKFWYGSCYQKWYLLLISSKIWSQIFELQFYILFRVPYSGISQIVSLIFLQWTQLEDCITHIPHCFCLPGFVILFNLENIYQITLKSFFQIGDARFINFDYIILFLPHYLKVHWVRLGKCLQKTYLNSCYWSTPKFRPFNNIRNKI